MQLKRGEAKFVLECVAAFAERFEADVVAVLVRELHGVEPPAVHAAREELQLLLRQLESRQSPVRVHDAMDGLVKRVLLAERRRVAERLETPLAKAVDPGVVRQLGLILKRFDELLASPELEAVRPARLPRLNDFLSIRFAREAGPRAAALLPRSYDEKFHVLEAPALFVTDLAYHRAECDLRGNDLAVLYLDIDDFKAVNTRFGETRVDLEVLRPFVEMLEAWSYGRGHSYRFGGDEYVALFPNADASGVVALVEDLRSRLRRVRFAETKVALTVSTGVVVVAPDCSFADREVLLRANHAKSLAKTQKGTAVVLAPPAWDDASARRF